MHAERSVWLSCRPCRTTLRLAIGAAFAFAVSAARLAAQAESAPLGIAVKVYVTGKSNGAALSVSGTFLESAPGAGDGYASASVTSSDPPGVYASALLGTGNHVRVEAGKSYIVSVSAAAGATDCSLNIVAPPGYRVAMDGVWRSRLAYEGSTDAVIVVHRSSELDARLAGVATALAANEIEWKLSLGSLKNGGSAGSLALVDTGTRTSWAPIFSPSLLTFEALSDEVAVYRPSNVISQVIANQVALDVVTLSATAYVVRCYHPGQLVGGSFPFSFSGQPFAAYTIEQGATATTLKLTREIRDTSAGNLNAPVSRRESMSLERTGAWPTFGWKRTEWTLDGASPLSETIVTNTGTAASRTETIVVRTPGTGAGVLSLTRNFTALANIGDAQTGETLGTNTGLVGAYAYHTDGSDFGSLGHIKSATLPGGKWVAFDYYPAALASGQRGGRVKRTYRPFLDAPASVSTQASLGVVTYQEYVNDVFGAPMRPSLVETTVNGVVTTRTTTAYNDAVGSVNGYPLTETVTTAQVSTARSLETVTRQYRNDVGLSLIRGQLYSVVEPDGVKTVYVYQRGTWNGTSFSVGSGALGSGSASRISVIRGSKHAAAGAACPNIDSYTVESLYLVDGKSTMEVTIRDSRALVVRTETHARKAGAWNLVGWSTFTNDFAGRVTQRTMSNGAVSSATYEGGLKKSETDEQGVVTTYAYDAMGRVSTKTRQGFGAIATVVTTYKYDAAGRVLEEQTGAGPLDQRIIRGFTYDDAGRMKQVRPPGNYGVVNYTYDAAARRQTETAADGATTVTELYRDGRVRSKTGTGVVASYHTYGVESSGPAMGQRWQRVDAASANSLRNVRTWTDWLGRTVKTEVPGFTGQPLSVTENLYDQAGGASVPGRLLKTTRTGFRPTLYVHDRLGNVVRSGMDVDDNGSLDPASSDRISDAESYFENTAGAWWIRTDRKAYLVTGRATAAVATSRRRLTAFPQNRFSEVQEIDVEGNVETTTLDVYPTTRTALATTSRTGFKAKSTATSLNGLQISVTGFDSRTTTTYYDALLRPAAVVDPRGNRTTSEYRPGTTLVEAVTNQAGNRSVRIYDTMGRVAVSADPKGHSTRTSYTLRGEVHRQWGDGTMPVQYGYDAYGQRTTLSTYRAGSGWDGATWPASQGTADTTTWSFHEPTGLTTAKTDALGRAVTWTYNLRGQTATRTFARGVTTTYQYADGTGDLTGQTYSDSTPAVTYQLGRGGRVEAVSDFTGTRDFIFDPAKPWRLAAEAHDDATGSFYGGRVLSRLYHDRDVIGREAGFRVGTEVAPAADLEQTYEYTGCSRVRTVGSWWEGNSVGRTFRYGYLPQSRLVQSLVIDEGVGPGGHPFTVTRTYETQRDLLTSLETKWSTASRTKYAYLSDERGQRTSVVQSGDVFADFGGVDNGATFRKFTYNGRGELTADAGYLGANVGDDSKPLNGRRHEFEYDEAGNREWSNRTGVTDLRNDYTVNALNQYTARENNTVPVSGTAAPDAGGVGGVAIAVQGRDVPAGRQGRYWNDEVVVGNTIAPWRGPLTIYAAKRGASGSPDYYRTDIRMAQVARAAESLTYDHDGNLTSDGISDYTWDAENRLVKVETNAVGRAAGFPHRIVELRYDYMGRRVQRTLSEVGAGGTVQLSRKRFLYEGWRMVAEYVVESGGSVPAIYRTYTWGLDVVGSLRESGGVGGLLQIADHRSRKTFLPAYDGKGNVVALFNGETGSLAAAYEYNAFGEYLRVKSPDPVMADNPFRFSTKYTDEETGLVDYGRRHYDPRNGRFLGRDPIEEDGGLNLYGFVGNNPVNRWDILGMVTPEDARNLLKTWESFNLFLGTGDTLTHGHPGSSLGEVTGAEDFDLVMTRSELEKIAGLADGGNYYPDGTPVAYGDFGDIQLGWDFGGSVAPSNTATTQPATTNSPYWTGTVDYRQGGFILGGGTFSGTVVGPNGQRGTVTGYIVSAGLQIGIYDGSVQVTFSGTQSGVSTGTNGGFFSGQVDLGYGPLQIVQAGGNLAAYVGPVNADLGAFTPNNSGPGISTNTSPTDPGGYLDARLGFGGALAFNGFVVTGFTPDP